MLDTFGQYYSLADPRSIQSQATHLMTPATAPSPASYQEITACQIGNHHNASCCGCCCCRVEPQAIARDDPSPRCSTSCHPLFLHQNHQGPPDQQLSPWNAAVAYIFSPASTTAAAAAAQQDIYASSTAHTIGTNNTYNNYNTYNNDHACFFPPEYEDAVVHHQAATHTTRYSPWEENHHHHARGSGSIDRAKTTADDTFHHRPRQTPQSDKKRCATQLWTGQELEQQPHQDPLDSSSGLLHSFDDLTVTSLESQEGSDLTNIFDDSLEEPESSQQQLDNDFALKNGCCFPSGDGEEEEEELTRSPLSVELGVDDFDFDVGNCEDNDSVW